MNPSRRAFTIVELCVVLAIASIVLALSIPALGAQRQKTREEVCKDNLAVIGKALLAYSQDHKGFLPPIMEPSRTPWYKLMNKYAGEDPTKAGIGEDYRRCATQHEDAYRTYGVHYCGVWPFGNTSYGPKVDSVNNRVFLAGDAHIRDWGRGDYNWPGAIYNNNLGPWRLNVDWDGDGVNDTARNQINQTGPYNVWGPWHFSRGNFLFMDGRVESVTVEDWIANKDGLTMTYRE